MCKVVGTPPIRECVPGSSFVNKVEGKTLVRYFLGNHGVGETVAQQRRIFPGGLFLSAAALAAKFAFLSRVHKSFVNLRKIEACLVAVRL